MRVAKVLVLAAFAVCTCRGQTMSCKGDELSLDGECWPRVLKVDGKAVAPQIVWPKEAGRNPHGAPIWKCPSEYVPYVVGSRETCIPKELGPSQLTAPVARKEQIRVHIVEQKESEGEFVVSYPGYQQSNCGVYAYGNQALVNCSALSLPGGQRGYVVKGYAITLLLPDKRIVVATCSQKLNWTDWSTPTTYRSCRHPITGDIDAEFDGENVKLFWPVSIDGKKTKSEAYKIEGVLSPAEDTR